MSLIIKQLRILHSEQALFPPLSFEVPAGTVFSLMGPSGCGKSTLLSAIAGHLSCDFTLSGELTLNGQSLLSRPANQRKVGLLFQDDLLFPHLSVFENLLFAVPRNLPKDHRIHRAMENLNSIGLSALAKHMPDQISGGQRARISLIRMLLSEPQAVLLDEPFNKLDKALRHEFRQLVFSRLHQQRIPTIMVTHDEADVPSPQFQLNWPWTTQEPLKC